MKGPRYAHPLFVLYPGTPSHKAENQRNSILVAAASEEAAIAAARAAAGIGGGSGRIEDWTALQVADDSTLEDPIFFYGHGVIVPGTRPAPGE